MAPPHPALVDLAAGRELPTVADPTAVLRSALEHRMVGLLLAELERTPSRAWRPVVPVLRARQVQTRHRHHRLWEGLESATVALAGAGIEVAVTKGVVAEARWYSGLGERPSSDLDLVLSPAQVDRLDDAIGVLEPTHPLRGKASALARRGLLQSVDLDHAGVPIDLHVDVLKLGITSRAREAIWARTIPFRTPQGTTLRVLDAESSLLHFLVHLNKDRFFRLLGYVDVARVGQREEIDHGAVAALAVADGITTSVHATWNVVFETLGIDAPRLDEGPDVRRRIWHFVWPTSVRLLGEEGKVRFRQRQWLIAVLARRRGLEALAAWGHSVVPPRDLLAYAHSDYATRWGSGAVSDLPGGYLRALTEGRLRTAAVRRRAARASRRAGAEGPGPHGRRNP